jgi:pimeloyl-ACP methyl ester carboxylesterase
VVNEADLSPGDGRTLHFYDAGSDDPGAVPVFWLHGTPNVGAPPEPLFAAAAERGLRWISYDRPGYGGSSPHPGRNVASAAADVVAIADALGLGQFAVMGHSGGGPHALACGALLPDRVFAVVSGSSLAPLGAQGLDWFAGQWPAVEAEHRAAVAGRAALEAHVAAAEFDPGMFTPADLAALSGPWEWLGEVAQKAVQGGTEGMVDDDLALVGSWGFDPAAISAPVLIMHGEKDRMVPVAHGQWLAAACPTAELRLLPGDGHVSVLSSADGALDWIAARAPR